MKKIAMILGLAACMAAPAFAADDAAAPAPAAGTTTAAPAPAHAKGKKAHRGWKKGSKKAASDATTTQ